MLRTIKQLIAIILIFTLFHSSLEIQFPDDFKLCHRSDPEFNGCLRTAIQEALPKLIKGVKWLKLPRIEPLTVLSVEVGEGTNVVRFTQKYKNLKMHNMSDAIIKSSKANWDPGNLTLEVVSLLKHYSFDANFELEGRVLVFPITGSGSTVIALKNVTQILVVRAEEYKKADGKTYMKVSDVDVKLTTDRLYIRFDNLFNEKLGNHVNFLLNDNWSLVFDEVKESFEEVFAQIYRSYINKIFTKIPADQLFLP